VRVESFNLDFIFNTEGSEGVPRRTYRPSGRKRQVNREESERRARPRLPPDPPADVASKGSAPRARGFA